MVDSPVPDTQSRYFPETGCTVEGAFLNFLRQYGIDFCGLPLTDSFLDNGIPTQYFQRLALEEPTPGQLRLKAIGSEVIHLREQLRAEKPAPVPQPSGIVLGIPPFELVNQVGSLPRHATARYPSRPLDHIRQLVVHHTGAPPNIGAEQIAGYHVTALGWPAIGYHFVIDQDGRVAQTNALATIAYHARQYNGSGVGIALVGNYAHSAPSREQLDGAAVLCAWLLRELSLPIESIKGHQELVNVACPGDQWLDGARWKFALMDRVEQLLAGAPIPKLGAVADPGEPQGAEEDGASSPADERDTPSAEPGEAKVETLVTPPLPQDVPVAHPSEPHASVTDALGENTRGVEMNDAPHAGTGEGHLSESPDTPGSTETPHHAESGETRSAG